MHLGSLGGPSLLIETYCPLTTCGTVQECLAPSIITDKNTFYFIRNAISGVFWLKDLFVAL